MEMSLQTWIENTVHSQKILSVKKIPVQVYYALQQHSKGNILMVHGFCEFFGKYHEMFRYLYEAGYSVFFVELRGYGHSGNTKKFEDHRVYVGNFDEYVGDVHAAYRFMTSLSNGKKNFLFSHSMGGAVAALYLETYPHDFTGAVLSSPMIRMNYGSIPEQIIDLLPIYAKVRRLYTEYAPGQHGWNKKYAFSDSNCTDEQRYAYAYRQRLSYEGNFTWGGTWKWAIEAKNACDRLMREADRIQIPVLLFQADQDTVVQNEAQNQFQKKVKTAIVVPVAHAKHEIFGSRDEVFYPYMKAIVDFYSYYAE